MSHPYAIEQNRRDLRQDYVKARAALKDTVYIADRVFVDDTSPAEARDMVVRAFEEFLAAFDQAIAGGAQVPPRYQSQDVADLREDVNFSLADALDKVLGPALSEDNRQTAADLIDGVKDFGDIEDFLGGVLTAFGPAVYGAVLLHNLEAKNTLWNASNIRTGSRELASVGLTVRDLGWPNSALKPEYQS